MCSLTEMGRTYLRTLGECEKHGVVLVIICRTCQRKAFAAPFRLIGLKVGGHALQRDTYLAQIEPRLLCRGSNGEVGCGARGARIQPTWPHEIPGVPRGVPVLEWLHADDRERTRLLRIARD